MGPRWSKVIRDLSGNKVRSLLVILSVAVGVFATGIVISAQSILSRELPRSYLASQPSTAVIYTAPFDEQLLDSVRSVRGVTQVEGRRSILVRAQVGPNTWRSLQLFAIPDFHNIQVDIVQPESGAWPPPKRGFVIERQARELVPANIGSRLTIETSDGKRRDVTLDGVAHDMILYPSNLAGRAYGYITYDTLEWLIGSRGYTEVHVVMDPSIRSRRAIQDEVELIRKKIEAGGVTVGSAWIPPYPDKPPVNDIIQALIGVLGALGVLSLLLSVFLIVNIISALLAQQTRQIGVMKAIGARVDQIVAMYSGMIAIVGVLAVAVAVPAGIIGAHFATSFVASYINYDITSFSVPVPVFLLQIAIGLLMPLLAALYPILSGTRVTVREAISPSAGAGGAFGTSLIDRLVGRIQFLSRPLLISLRNTVRRKGRLALTLLTLTMAGAIFMATLSVRSSATETLVTSAQFWNYDVELSFPQNYRAERIAETALQTPGVARIESWLRQKARRLRADGREGNAIDLIAPTAGTTLIRPRVLQGRWLLPEDENAIVLNTDALKDEPDVRVGDQVTLLLGERKTTWQVVGIVAGHLDGSAIYANYSYVAQVAREAGQANFVVVETQQHSPAFRSTVARALDEQLKAAGLRLSSAQTTTTLFAGLQNQFDVLVIFLFIMALLLGIVGGLGLTGTMSLNVLERTREIGIMRAVGASNRTIFQIVIVEGICIGLISWLLGALCALPISRQMSATVGMALLQTPLDYRFSLGSVALWLGIVLALAALASGLPAWNATRVRVRDVLAYE